MSETFEQIL